MYCPVCGTNNEDNVLFCQNCGSRINEQEQINSSAVPQQPYQQQNSFVQENQAFNSNQNMGYQQPFQPQNAYGQSNGNYQQPFVPNANTAKTSKVRSNHPVLNELKNLGASPLFLVAIISYSVYVLFNLISLIDGSYSPINQLLYSSGLSDYLDFIDNMYSGLNIFFLTTSIINAIPIILMCVGMWMIFSTAISKNSGGMKTSGLTIIKVISIIDLVITCVCCAVLLVLLIIAAVAACNTYSYYSYNSNSSTLTGIMIGVIAIVCVVFTFIIIYQAFIIKTINTIKGSINTGVASTKVSGFVAVMCFLSGLGQIIGLFSSYGFVGVMNCLALATTSITFGIFIFVYKNKMKPHINSSVAYQTPQQSVQQPNMQQIYAQQNYSSNFDE